MSRNIVLSEAIRQGQRRAADPAASIWVAANAGSGKTHVLTERVLRLLLSGVKPESILCLTYTKAAAAEMRERVARRLAEWALADDADLAERIGEVEGRTCILVDDIVDSGGTLCNAAEALLAKGAKEVYAYITHGVLSGGAVARITSSRLKELVITDSIQPTEAVKKAANIRSLPIANLIGEAISRTAAEESVSSLFD